MDFIRLTNLGNMALRNIMRTEKLYEENAPVKLAQMAKLWPSVDALLAFRDGFSGYHNTGFPTQAIIGSSGQHGLMQVNGQATPLPITLRENLPEYGRLGLTTTGSESSIYQVMELIQTDERKNPLKYCHRVMIELTGLCNMACRHCYRGGSKPGEYGLPADTIKAALKPLMMAGISSVTCTGGEPTLRMEDLLDILGFASQYMALTPAGNDYESLDSLGLLTNGTFANKEVAVDSLLSLGHMHFQASLDSPDPETHDANRGRRGSYTDVKDLARILQERGTSLHIYASNLSADNSTDYRAWESKSAVKKTEGITNLGNAAINGIQGTLHTKNNDFGLISPDKPHNHGWCKGFTRPSKLHIRPTGDVGNCVLGYGLPSEFGNLNTEPMNDILNNIQDSQVYRTVKDGLVELSQNIMPRHIFKGPYCSSCEPFILTLATVLRSRELQHQGIADSWHQASLDIADKYKLVY